MQNIRNLLKVQYSPSSEWSVLYSLENVYELKHENLNNIIKVNIKSRNENIATKYIFFLENNFSKLEPCQTKVIQDTKNTKLIGMSLLKTINTKKLFFSNIFNKERHDNIFVNYNVVQTINLLSLCK